MNRLLRKSEEFDVTVLNRGKTPWPFEKECCKRLRCDRLNDRKRFRETIESEKDFDVIVDFVAFSVENVRDVIVSTKKTCHYTFISTDSVHMACLPPKDAKRALREDDAVLGAKLSKRLRKIRGSYQIQYGLSKLQAEQYLRDEAKDRYTALRYGLLRLLFVPHSTTTSNTHRFPDIYGPHDNQDGFINTLQKLKSGDSIGRLISRDTPQTQKSLSFVFVDDAVSAIMSAIKIGPISTSLNICHDEHIEWTKFVEIMAASLSPSISDIRWNEKEEPEMISVTVGPIDNALAKRRLIGWKPTSLRKAIEFTVQWYEKDPRRVVETLRMAESSSDSSSDGSESEEEDSSARRTKKRQRCDDEKKTFKFNFSI